MATPEIYATIEELSQPAKLPGKWARVPCHTAFFSATSDVLRQLLTRFSQDDLIAAGVYEQDPDGHLVLSTLLRGEANLMMAIRKRSVDPPVQLVVEGHILQKNAPAGLTIFNDYRIAALAQDSGEKIFVAATLEDVAILWSCGLPAIVHLGLAGINSKGLDWLCTNLQKCSSSPAGTEDGEQEEALVLMNWSLAQFDLSDQAHVPALMSHFLKLQEYLERCIPCRTWKPTEQVLEKIKFCIRYGTPPEIQNAIIASCDTSTFESGDAPQPPKSAPIDYAGALQAWLNCQEDQVDRLRRQESWATLQQVQERELILPLLQRMVETFDPLAGNLLATLAHLCRLSHTRWATLAAALQSTAWLQDRSAPLPGSADEIKQLMALAEQVKSLIQELRGSQTRSTRK